MPRLGKTAMVTKSIEIANNFIFSIYIMSAFENNAIYFIW